MQTKEKFINYIKEVSQVLEPLKVADSGLSSYPEKINQAELIIPVVGGFSAGKSTLINAFIGEDLLPTAITPETALATELRFSETNAIEAVTADDKVVHYDINQFAEIKDNAQNFKYLRLYLNNANLRAIQPLVLVDMPGFDSPVEMHNQAILNYLTRGVYFVFLTSVEDGAITRSMLQEIKNICLFGKGFSFCLSKTNLRAASDVSTVKDAIQSQLKTQFNFDKNVVLVDDDGGQSLKNILDSIDPEALLQALFIDDLQANYFTVSESINVAKSALNATKEESEYAIKSLKDSVAKLEHKKQSAIDDIKRRYANSQIDRVVTEVSKTVINQREYLIHLAMNNSGTFSDELSGIVKNSLLAEVKSVMSDVSADVVNDFTIEVKDTLKEIDGFDFNDEFVGKMATTVETGLKKSTEFLTDLNDRMKKDGSNSTVYRMITTILGLTTSVVNPIVEVVLVFLPDIISLFTQDRQKQQQRQRIEEQLSMRIVPEIKAKIRAELPAHLQTSIATMIQQVSASFEQQLQQKQDEIATQQAEKKQHITTLESQLEAMDSAQKALKNLANTYLF